MEEPNNYENFDEVYKESIKDAVNSDSYFKDAFNWYSAAFLRPITDRTFFIFMFIMGLVIIYNVIFLINMLLPLKQDIYISIREKDLTKYYTRIYDISKNKEAESTDEDILKYLATNYVKERESHNYKTANIADINRKLEVIRNNSSPDVANEFNMFMSRDNPNGPFYYFGKNIETSVTIDSFKFIRVQRRNFIAKIKDYFNIQLMPLGAEIYYTLKTQIGDNITYQKRRAVISFKFNGIDYDETTKKYSPIQFTVTNYQNYVVQ